MNSDSGDASSIQELQRQLIEVKAANKRLSEEQQILQGQYDEAMTLAAQVTEKHNENAKLKKQINSIKAEKDEVEHRLKIALQVNEGLKDRDVNPDPQVFQYTRELSVLKDQMAREQAKYSDQLRLLNEQLQETVREGEWMKTRNSELEASISSLLEAAQAKYGTVFSSANEFHQFLLAPDTPTQESDKNTGEETLQELLEASDRAIEKLQKRLKEERKARKFAVAQARQGEDEYNQRKAVLEKVVYDLESQVEEAQRTIRETELSHKHEMDESDLKIQHLEGSIEVLKQRNEQLKKEKEHLEDIQRKPNPLAIDVAQLKDRVKIQEEQLKDSGSSVVSLKKQVKGFMEELKATERARRKLEDTVKCAEEKAKELSEEITTMRNEKEQLAMENEDLKENLENSRAQLSAAKLAVEQSDAAFKDLEVHANEIQNVNRMLQDQIERQKKEIVKMHDEREKVTNLMQKLWAFAQVTEENFESVKKANKKLKADVKQMSIARMNETTKTQVETVPQTAWLIPEFPSDLREMVTDLARSEVLPLSARLKHILTAIGKYYRDLVNEKETQITKKQQSMIQICDQLDHFFVSLGTVLESDQFSAEGFISNGTMATNLINSIARMKEKLQEALNDKRIEQLKTLFEQLNVDSFDCAIKELARQRQELAETSQLLKDEVQKNRRLKKQNNLILQDHAERQKCFKKLIDEQNDRIEILEAESKTATKVIEEQTLGIEELKNKIEVAHQEAQDEIAQIKEGYEDVIHSMNEKYEKERQQLTEELDAHREALTELSATAKKQKKEIGKLKKTLDLTRQMKLETEEELKSLVSQLEETKNIQAERLAETKESVKSQYEELVQRLKTRINELRKLLAESNESLSDSESKNKDLMKRLRSNEREIEAAKRKVVLKDEELVRERQLLESRCQAVSIQSEMKCQTLIEEMKAKHEEEKTKLCSFVIKHFKELFDGRQYVDVSCMKQIVELASSEYHRLLMSDESIRRLLGIGMSESTEDAVSKLLLSF